MIEIDPNEHDKELGAEVIPLRGVEPTQALTVIRGKGYCDHYGVSLDSQNRTVKCRSCWAPLDPFDRLLRFAREWDTFRSDRERCKADTKAARAALDLLERREKNALARAKRQFDVVPSKQELRELVDGHLWLWSEEGFVGFASNRKMLTPEQARNVARELLKAARKAEEPRVTDPETGERMTQSQAQELARTRARTTEPGDD